MLSIPMMRISATSWKRLLTRLLPIKPAAPVTKTVLLSKDMFDFNMLIRYFAASISSATREMFSAVKTRRQNDAISNRGRRCRGYRLYL